MVVMNMYEAFSDDLLVSLCEYLPAFSVISLNLTCRSLSHQIANSVWLWRSITRLFMGTTLLKSHLAQRGAKNEIKSTDALFYKRLFFQCLKCDKFTFAPELRSVCLSSICANDKTRFGASGHTATGIDNKLVMIGGWQGIIHQTPPQLCLCVVDIDRAVVVNPQLDHSSVRPGPLLRHSTCKIARPSWLPQTSSSLEARGDFSENSNECLLVIGGRELLNIEHYGGGVYNCLLLEFLSADGSLVKWHRLNLTGKAPTNIWHHSSCSFHNGEKIVMFGGDMHEDDPEFPNIANRSQVNHVYILDVESKVWSAVITTGPSPSWRSLHVGVTYKSIVDNRERLIVVGGTADHLNIFESGSTTDFKGYALDLEKLEWFNHSQHEDDSTDEFHPVARMRCAAEVYGRHLVVYGGHDAFQPILSHDKLIKLDLLSLKWSTIEAKNNPYRYLDAISSQLAGGLLVGGVHPSTMTTCEMFEFILLEDS